ncbi:hypothetical protein KKA18_03375 [Patescibacteria group bacterium]|nr:hypothetical protein [Patescibacteria group bacterium]
MFLDLRVHDYDRDIAPFLRKGIIIDTSVFKIIVDGIVKTRISKKNSTELKEILDFLYYIKVNNRWNKFFITPHILTEICTRLRNDYRKHRNYKEIVKEIIPILTEMNEHNVGKEKIMGSIDFKNPIIEIGDISICLVADDYINNSEKIAILSNDYGLNTKYQDSKNVMVMDYKANIRNLI